MRWRERVHLDRRIVKRFLLFPCCIQGECRWLETAYIIRRRLWEDWSNQTWATKEEYLGWCKEVGHKEKETQ